MLVDSHCHLDFPDFADELPEVIARAGEAGIGIMVTISTRVRKFAQVLAIAERFDNVYCSVGTHPHNAAEELDVTAEELVELAAHPKVVAIGEAGLDYFYDKAPRDIQEKVFRTHISAARATGLPLVIHSRDADEDMERILRDEMAKGRFHFVLHCFSSGTCRGRSRSRRLRLFLGHPDIQQVAGAARYSRHHTSQQTPCGNRLSLPRTAALAGQAQ